MESLTGPFSQEDQNENEPKVKTKSNDRVTLGKNESEKVELWLKQIDGATKGFLCLNKSDMINFLIREHRDDLSSQEHKRLKSDNYNPIKHLNWLAPLIKQALAKGDTVRVAELQSELRGVELSVIGVATQINDPITRTVLPDKTTRGRKKKQNEKIGRAHV